MLYVYKLDKKYFNLWCELGRLLLRQSQMFISNTLCSLFPAYNILAVSLCSYGYLYISVKALPRVQYGKNSTRAWLRD